MSCAYMFNNVSTRIHLMPPFLIINNESRFIFNPQFLQLHLDPASSNTLPASDNGSIKQKLRVTNSQHGKVFELHTLIFLLSHLVDIWDNIL